MKLLKTSDQVALSFGEVKVICKPLSYFHKIESQKFRTVENGEEKQDYPMFLHYLVKHSILSISGFDVEGDRKLELELKDGSLTDESTSDAINVLLTLGAESFVPVRSVAVYNSMPSLADPTTGEVAPGVKAELYPNGVAPITQPST